MNIIFIIVFLLITPSKGKMIECYTCSEGFELIPNIEYVDVFDHTVTIPRCSRPIENSVTFLRDSEYFSCIKLTLPGYVTERADRGILLSGILRYYARKGKCKYYKKIFNKAQLPDDLGPHCLECDEDKCNSTSKIQFSITLIIFLIIVQRWQ